VHALQVINPANGTAIAEMSSCGRQETEKAISKAAEAWKSWRRVPASQRETFLLDWKAKIMQSKSDIAKIMTLECGKPLKESENEIAAGVASLDWFAGEAIRWVPHGLSCALCETMQCRRGHGRAAGGRTAQLRVLCGRQPRCTELLMHHVDSRGARCAAGCGASCCSPPRRTARCSP
jgi:Aldehyde dehydrogenase family